MTRSIDDAIFGLLAERKLGQTICPSEAARSVFVGPEPDGWRRLMPQVHEIAADLARTGRLVITQGGEAVDPDAFAGAYRLRLPREGAS